MENKKATLPDDSIAGDDVMAKHPIKVSIHIPEKVSENIRQQKINRIYDILKPKNSA